MKIAISGKGGVGKSTVCALMCEAFVEAGKNVLAIDSDPSPHLGRLLGFDTAELRPIAEMSELLMERSERNGLFYNLNPRVDDLPEKFMLKRGAALRLMVLGAVQKGGAGCACAENAVLRNLLSILLLSPDDIIIMDMEAGVEHLGRATIQGIDHLLIVIQPYRGSIDTAIKIVRMAKEIGIRHISAIANGIKDKDSQEDISYIQRGSGLDILCSLPESDAIRRAEREEKRLYAEAPSCIKDIIRGAIRKIKLKGLSTED